MRKVMLLRALLALFLFALMAGSAGAADAPASGLNNGTPAEINDVPDITLLTFGPGPIYWERFGHNAILVQDHHDDLAYNYGVFDFSQENFFLNFARGRMSYRMSADPVYLDLRFYDREGRWIVAQHLDLTAAQRLQLRDFLLWNAQPENMRYRYDYFTSNCSTRVRDALDRVLGGALKQQFEKQMTAASYRSEALRLISPDRWLMLAMDIALGPSADRPLNVQQQSFVPMVLMDAVRSAQISDAGGRQHPLVDNERRIVPGRLPDAPTAAPDFRKAFLLVGLGFAALLLRLTRDGASGTARTAAALLASLFALISGLGGIILALLWAATEHWAGWRNQNLLLFDPLCLALLPAVASQRSPRAVPLIMQRLALLVAVLALAAATMKLIPVIPRQENWQWIALLLPSQVVIAFLLWRANHQNR